MVGRHGAGVPPHRRNRPAVPRGTRSSSVIVRGLTQEWPRATHPRPIVLIGAGGIARTAHLPVYRRLAYPVAGVFDVDGARAGARAGKLGVANIFDSMADAVRQRDVVFDAAVPADRIEMILAQLPAGSAV